MTNVEKLNKFLTNSFIGNDAANFTVSALTLAFSMAGAYEEMWQKEHPDKFEAIAYVAGTLVGELTHEGVRELHAWEKKDLILSIINEWENSEIAAEVTNFAIVLYMSHLSTEMRSFDAKEKAQFTVMSRLIMDLQL